MKHVALENKNENNVSNKSDHKPSKGSYEQIFIDISSVKGKKYGPQVQSKLHWRIMVDERTNLKFTKFFSTSNGIIEPNFEQIEKWENNGLVVKHIHLEISGEKKKLKEQAEIKDCKINIDFEYTARYTLQKSHLEDMGFSVLTNKGTAMMYHSNVPTDMRYQILPKAFETGTFLDGLVVADIDGKRQSIYEHFFGKELRCVKYLRTWGEAGTVKINKKTSPKLADQGILCMFVGYNKDREGDCYDMLHMLRRTIYQSRDVAWLKRMYYQKELYEDN